MTKKEILDELRKQDKELNAIHKRRDELAQICRDKGMAFYNKVWEELMNDGKGHWSF